MGRLPGCESPGRQVEAAGFSKAGLQALYRPAEQARDRVRRAVHARRDLLQGQPFDAREEDYLAVLGAQGVEGLLQTVEPLRSTEHPRLGDPWIGDLRPEGRGPLPRPAAGLVEDLMLGDPPEPAYEGVLSLPVEMFQGVECAEERLLEDVLRLVLLPEVLPKARENQRLDPRLVELDEIVEAPA